VGHAVLPLWLLLVAIISVAIVIAVGSVSVANRALAGVGREHNSAVAPFVTVVGAINGALIGFTVVVSWQQFSATQVIISNEASALTTMYRQTAAMREPERPQLQQLLRQYAKAVEGLDSDSTDVARDSARGAVTQMYRIVGNQPSATTSAVNSAFLNQLTVLASDRTERIVDTRPRIPALLWAALIFGAIVLVVLSGFLRLGNNIAHIFVSSTIAVLLGVLMCTVFALDHPFETDQAITSEPFLNALQLFDAVDRET
jgi:hypothetical protein